MTSKRLIFRLGLIALLGLMLSRWAAAQEKQPGADQEFGPVVRAYLGYLNDEQEVVDDRASRHEITSQFYRRNSNRIRALRQIAVSIARETNNDYLPELEAAARDELKTLFDKPPNPRAFRVGEVLANTFRYLGSVHAGEVFYVFARLDPYEQSELMEKEKRSAQTGEPKSVSATPAASPGTGAAHP